MKLPPARALQWLLLPVAASRPTRPRHLPADERRAVTVAAVIALAAEQNPQEITTTAIADRMSLTQGALFRHFPAKEAIWQALMEWVAKVLLARLDDAALPAASPLAARELIKRAVQTLLEQNGLRQHALVEQGIAQGELDREVDPTAAATLFIGSIQSLVMQALSAGKVRHIRAAAPGAFAVFARGVRRAP